MQQFSSVYSLETEISLLQNTLPVATARENDGACDNFFISNLIEIDLVGIDTPIGTALRLRDMPRRKQTDMQNRDYVYLMLCQDKR